MKKIELSPDCTIYHADNRDIMNTLEFDAILTDPPYGISFRKDQDNNSEFFNIPLLGGSNE